MSNKHFIYDSGKRNAIVLLSAIILVIIALMYFYKPQTYIDVTASDAKGITIIQKRVDSLRQVAIDANKPKIYPFNPNFLNDYKAYKLGMSPEEINRLMRFRESGKKYVNSALEFQKVTGVSDSILNKISPYFKFPEWVNKQAKKGVLIDGKQKEHKRDLNFITSDILLTYDGVSPKMAANIIKVKNGLGGFLVDEQLYDFWGVPRSTVRNILKDFTIKQQPQIDKMSINTVTASDLNTFPFVNWDLATNIVDYRLLHGEIKDIDSLSTIEGMTARKLSRIKLYLKL